MCSSAFEKVPYSLENYTVKNEQFETVKKTLQYVTSIVFQWLEHCVSSAKVVGSIPREHTY